MSTVASLVWSFLDTKTVALLAGVWWTTQFLIWKGYIFAKGRPAPGIYGVPFFGCVPYFMFSKKTSFELLEEFSKQYGPVMRMRFGMKTSTIVLGTAAVREGMMNDALLGRPPQEFDDEELRKAYEFTSLITLEGDIWKKHRRFSLITLRDLGFGKTPIMEDIVQEEIRDVVSFIEKREGEPMDLQDVLVPSTSNNMASLVFGERLAFEHPKRKEFNYLLTAFNDDSSKFIAIALVPRLLQILHHLNIGVVRKLKSFMQTFRKMIKEEIQSHQSRIDRENPRDYIDHYIIEQEKDKDFSDDLMGGNAMAFFSAGSSTVRTTVEYLLHLMAHMPEVQRKVQAELDELTGRSREVTWADSPQLVYTMAVIAERHRYFTVAPAGVGRRSLIDTKICGYDIPAKQPVMFSIDSVHYDPKTFPEPYEFRPERFISDDGKLINTDKVWAFSIGKRACPGESLAVLEVFLYFTNILLNFTIEAESPGGTIQLRPVRGLVPDTIRQKVRLVKRA